MKVWVLCYAASDGCTYASTALVGVFKTKADAEKYWTSLDRVEYEENNLCGPEYHQEEVQGEGFPDRERRAEVAKNPKRVAAGLKRAAMLSPVQRSAIANQAADARWHK